MQLPEQVFREYDIRGIAGREITEDFAYRLGRAFAAFLPDRESHPVITGRDVRLSGPELQQALHRGLNEGGAHVLDIGMVPTPLAYFATFRRDAAGCVMVTASHNPAEYNGFKMMRGRESLHGADIQHLKAAMRMIGGEPLEEAGTVRHEDVREEFIDFVVSDCRLARPLKVVIDAGNGPSGLLAAPIYRRLGCEVIELFCEPDGRFPNHHPDPTVEENMTDLARTVRAEQADLGLAFDGDGDRIGVVDEQGRIIWGDMLLTMLARDLLERHPGATIISEVKCSRHMYEDIERRGGRAIMWRTGHSPIKAKMKETGALLAGEMSGHIFFADRYHGFDDAVYAGARILEVASRHDGPISTILADIPPSVTTPEIRIACPDDRKFALVEEARAHFQAQGYRIIDVDGVRIDLGDAWGLLRASNTQPSLVLRFEAPDPARLKEVREMIEGWLSEHLETEAG